MYNKKPKVEVDFKLLEAKIEQSKVNPRQLMLAMGKTAQCWYSWQNKGAIKQSIFDKAVKSIATYAELLKQMKADCDFDNQTSRRQKVIIKSLQEKIVAKMTDKNNNTENTEQN